MAPSSAWECHRNSFPTKARPLRAISQPLRAQLPSSVLACYAFDGIGSPLRLIVDPTVECFTSDHLPVFVAAFFIVAGLTISFPGAFLAFLFRKDADLKLDHDERFMERYNSLTMVGE